jgi:cytochrome c
MTRRAIRRGACAAAGSMLLWLGACGPAADAGAGVGAAGGDAARGQQLLARYHCGTCHTIPGVAAARGRFAASLEAFGRRSYIAGRVANEPSMLARWIAKPASIVPGTLMPDMGVSPEDARDIAAYLGQLK